MAYFKNDTLLTLEEVCSSCDGIHILGNGDFYFTSVYTDSRQVRQGSLFVPLIGEAQDGHTYIPQAVEKGAGAVTVCMANYEKNPNFFTELSQKNPSVFFIAVENPIRALQKIAAAYVSKFPDLIKIGITGSSGKTTTKELLVAMLSQKYSVVSNVGNLNSETGLPLSVFNIRENHQVGVFEMGMNREHEIEEIAAVLKPRFALITNIGTAHIGNLGSRQNIANEKAHIFDYFHGIGSAFIPSDDDFTSFLSDYADGNVVLYGKDKAPYIKNIVDNGLDGFSFEYDGLKTHLHFSGKYNFKNMLGAISVSRVLDVSPDKIANALENLYPLQGRSEILKGKYTIIKDCYNANPDSMQKAIGFISSLDASFTKVLVLGDMLELGEQSAEEHKRISDIVLGTDMTLVIFAGDNMKVAYKNVQNKTSSTKYYYVQGSDDSMIKKVSDIIKENAPEKSVVLLKGSRGMRLERIVDFIQEEL